MIVILPTFCCSAFNEVIRIYKELGNNRVVIQSPSHSHEKNLFILQAIPQSPYF